MRDIKFRAWDGNQMYLPSGLPVFLEEHFHFKDGTFKIIEGKKGILMQYTGLKDKNNKEIYDGDIVIFTPEKYELETLFKNHRMYEFYEIEFGCYGICLRPHSNIIYSWKDFITHATGNNLEVIGNIYENSELIKI